MILAIEPQTGNNFFYIKLMLRLSSLRISLYGIKKKPFFLLRNKNSFCVVLCYVVLCIEVWYVTLQINIARLRCIFERNDDNMCNSINQHGAAVTQW